MALPSRGTFLQLASLNNQDASEAHASVRDQVAFSGAKWEISTPYVHPCKTRGSDDNLYDSKQDSTGQDPTLDTAMVYWTPHKSFSFPGDEVNLSYEPTATQMAARRLLERNGASLLRNDYPELFAVIGTTYGASDGTHFNLPDDCGRFERMWDHGSGIDPDAASRTDRGDGTTGDNVGTLQPYATEAHSHAIVNSIGPGIANTLQLSQAPSLGAGATTGVFGGNETRSVNINKWGGIFY